MGSKRGKRTALEEPPPASSASSAPFDEKEEEDTTPSKTRNPTSPMKKNPDAITQQQHAESDESYSGSGSDDDESDDDDHAMLPRTPSASSTSSPDQEDMTKLPDAVSTQQQQHHQEAEPEPATAATPTPVTTTRSRSPKTTARTSIVVAVSATGAKKRPSDAERNPAKRAKKDAESGEKSEVKKNLFERRWSEDDEIALLEGFWEFTEMKGISPLQDMNAFHDFIKKELHFVVKLIQLKDKISRLKKRFDKNLTSGKKGEDKTFSKAHDQKLFDLSKKIWGNDSRVLKNGIRFSERARSKALTNLKADLEMDATDGQDKDTTSEEEDKVDNMEIVEVTRKSFERMADHMVKRGLDVVGGDKKAELERKWRELHVNEMEVFLKWIELVEEHAKLALAFYNGHHPSESASLPFVYRKLGYQWLC